MDEKSDARLVQSCLAGNVKAFERLVEKYQTTVYNIAFRMTANFDDAEDIAQAVFIKIYEQLDKYNPKFKFFSWLYRIALNESLNARKQKKHLTELDDDIIWTNSVDKNYSRMETNERVQEALMLISAEQRLLIVLKHFEALSYQEIAFCLDLSEKKVKSRLYDARQMLKNVLVTRGMLQDD
ncbi:RNA polymerase sigma factor [candidate division KSB1 bacterium]|nr:RNA polymerase sigma factor [candidate division KSB1 bacterium]RQV99736.1 MAG: RNA polymerase sigma factor [candidate division KSB1 bacterium]